MKYRYTGSGIMTIHDSKGKPYTVSAENREVEIDEEVNVTGIELVGESTKKDKKVKKPKEESK